MQDCKDILLSMSCTHELLSIPLAYRYGEEKIH